MKVSKLTFGVLAGLLFQFAIDKRGFSAEAIPGSLAFHSISVDGTNLVFTAAIPAGIDNVLLEMRPSSTNTWETVAQLSSQSGEVSFTIPKPPDSYALFRLNAIAHSGATAFDTVSPELEYVSTRSLATHVSDGDAVFHFKGMIDGSDRILITRDGALWSHVNWDWPNGPVAVNGTQWAPAEKNYLTTPGTGKFLPEPFSLESVSLEKISGRDLITVERVDNGLLVYLDDTPCGADEYEFKIRFHPGRKITKQTRQEAVRLKIAAQIDGSDSVRITQQQATWEHRMWGFPQNVLLNGVPWDVSRTNILENNGSNAFLLSDVDFSKARIISRKGRDVATMWSDDKSMLISFADNPNGSDEYELEIGFGR